jgi:hypothetical protein
LNGCADKRPFKKRAIAEIAKVRSIAIHPSYADIEPYRCKFCGNWHLGHP